MIEKISCESFIKKMVLYLPMTEKLEVIANIFNDGCPQSDYYALLCIQGADSGRMYRSSCRIGSTIDELADDMKYWLSTADSDIFSRIYFVSQLVNPLDGRFFFQENYSVRPLTEEEFQELREKVKQPFTEEECEAYVDRYHAKFR